MSKINFVVGTGFSGATIACKLAEELKYLLSQMKYNTYWWNFKRLAYPLNWQFLNVFQKEFKELEKANLLSEKLLKEKDLVTLLKCKIFFYVMSYIKFNIKDIRRFLFRFHLKNSTFLLQVLGFQITNSEKKSPYLFSNKIK